MLAILISHHFYFQKGFSIICGHGVGEYIKNRRLSMAGKEVFNTDKKIIDIAMEYGYDSQDSFTKAFKRFHGSTPTEVRNNGATIKDFAPLRVNLILKGGYTMEYKIEEKEAFKVIGLKDSFKYESAEQEVPKLWKKFFMKSAFSNINAKYAVNIDTTLDCDLFDYVIGDDYNAEGKIPKDFEIIEIPNVAVKPLTPANYYSTKTTKTLNVIVVGMTGSGKSTLINSIFGCNVSALD